MKGWLERPDEIGWWWLQEHRFPIPVLVSNEGAGGLTFCRNPTAREELWEDVDSTDGIWMGPFEGPRNATILEQQLVSQVRELKALCRSLLQGADDYWSENDGKQAVQAAREAIAR